MTGSVHSPISVLTGEVIIKAVQKNKQGQKLLPELPRKPFKKFDKAKIQAALEAALQTSEIPPPSMAEVARRLGYNSSQLYHHFPKLCRAVAARYRSYFSTQRAEQLQRQCDEVRQAVLTLHAQGRYPSGWQLRKLLPSSAISLREPEVKATWKEMLQELGWKQRNFLHE